MFKKLSLAVLAAASVLSVSQFAQAKASTPAVVPPAAAPTSCAAGYELVYDLYYGQNTCVVITQDPWQQRGGNSGS